MKGRYAAALSGALALALIAFPGAVAAQTNAPIAQTGGMSVTLPLLGTPNLTVDVTLSATGDISGVTLGAGSTLTQKSADAGLVTFSNADGSATLKVRAGGSKLSIGAKAKTLDGLLGQGSWQAKVFGGSTASTVAYTIGKDSAGHPTVAIGAVVAAGGITTTPISATKKSDKKGSSAAAGVTFASNGFVKRLTVAVSVRADGVASLRITLSGKDRQKLTGTLLELAGTRSWAGYLCDGTAVGVAYHLTAQGALIYDGASGAPATAKDWPGGKGWHAGWFAGADKGEKAAKSKGSIVDGFTVRFTKTNVGFSAFLVKMADGSYALVAQGVSGRCGDAHATPKAKGAGQGPGPDAHDARYSSGKAGFSGFGRGRGF